MLLLQSIRVIPGCLYGGIVENHIVQWVAILFCVYIRLGPLPVMEYYECMEDLKILESSGWPETHTP